VTVVHLTITVCLTSAFNVTRKRALEANVSWIYVALFLWFGGRGLGLKLVAKPHVFSPAKAVKIGGQLVAQRFNNDDRKLSVPFVGLSGERGIFIC
jgi:hypothetical protein